MSKQSSHRIEETVRLMKKGQLPNGKFWCGCEAETSASAYFLPGHDKAAVAVIITKRYGSVVEFLVAHGQRNGNTLSDGTVGSDLPSIV